MTGVCEILIEGRRRRGWTQPELAAHAGVSLSTISRTEQKKGRPNANSLRRIAAAIGFDPEALVRVLRDPTFSAPPAWAEDAARSAVELPGQLNEIAPVLHAPFLMTRVPNFGSVSAVSADERFEQGGRYSEVPDVGVDFTVVVDGQCMEPRYEDGDTVGCSLRQWEREGFIWNRDYWVRFKNGESTLKRVRQDAKQPDHILFVPLNPQARHFSKPKSEIEKAARVLVVLSV